jgi:hypothetical protein
VTTISPAPNRVTPAGEIVAVSPRGSFMGNRGCLHDGREIVRPFRGRRWITCVTSFRGRKVAQWAPGRYTVLFFHDEAVALAAGHRPCAECRWADYQSFREAFARARGTAAPTADDLDRALHESRLDGRRQRRHEAPWAGLPAGTFVLHDDCPAVVLAEAVRPWSTAGYGEPLDRPSVGDATVLTPAATVAAVAAGYRPVLAL